MGADSSACVPKEAVRTEGEYDIVQEETAVELEQYGLGQTSGLNACQSTADQTDSLPDTTEYTEVSFRSILRKPVEKSVSKIAFHPLPEPPTTCTEPDVGERIEMIYFDKHLRIPPYPDAHQDAVCPFGREDAGPSSEPAPATTQTTPHVRFAIPTTYHPLPPLPISTAAPSVYRPRKYNRQQPPGPRQPPWRSVSDLERLRRNRSSARVRDDSLSRRLEEDGKRLIRERLLEDERVRGGKRRTQGEELRELVLGIYPDMSVEKAGREDQSQCCCCVVM